MMDRIELKWITLKVDQLVLSGLLSDSGQGFIVKQTSTVSSLITFNT